MKGKQKFLVSVLFFDLSGTFGLDNIIQVAIQYQ